MLLPHRMPRRALAASALIAAAFLAGCATPTAVSGSDAAPARAAQTYVNGITRLSAHFTQTGTDGAGDGFVWLERPGRLRVDYARPRPKLMLANHGRLLLADRLSGAVTTTPLSRTPLDILLAPSIPFDGPVTVTSVQQAPGVLAVSLVKTAVPNEGRLTLQFATAPMALTGLVVQDASGRTDTLALDGVRTNAAADAGDYTFRPSFQAGAGG